MNRIKLNPLAVATELDQHLPSVDPSDALHLLKEDIAEVSNFESNFSSLGSEYSFFVPMHYVKTYQYPLIVWLHDDGDNCDQLHRIMPWVSLQNYVGVAPQALDGDSNLGFYWEQTHDGIDHACQAVKSAIDRASLRANVASDRIFIGGTGSAGTMAFRVAFQHPELFRGVVSINGGLPNGMTPFARLGQSRLVDVFWSQCRDSKEFSTDQLCHQLRTLHAAGFSSTIRQYPCGDRHIEEQDSRFSPLSDLNHWIMDHIETAVK